MKIRLIACCSAILFAGTTNSDAYTQESEGYVKLKTQTIAETQLPSHKQQNFGGTPSLFRNDISTRVVRSFLRDFQDVSDVRWYAMNEGYAVYFFMNGVKTVAHYYKNGDMKCLFK